MTPQGQAQLISDEGREPKLYKDSRGIWSIGIGRNLEAEGLSDDEIDYLFQNDVKRHTVDCVRNILFWEDLKDTWKDVCINLCFNMGIHGLLGFRDMLAAMARGDGQGAAASLLDSAADHEEPNRIERLANILREG